jgi:hypothetical protein
VSYILDSGCPTCDGPVEMNLEWACTGDERCADPNHELTLVYRCWNDHRWESGPEDFPDDDTRGPLPPDIPSGEENLWRSNA